MAFMNSPDQIRMGLVNSFLKNFVNVAHRRQQSTVNIQHLNAWIVVIQKSAIELTSKNANEYSN